MLINTPTDKQREEAKGHCGAMLPGVDPTIGEIVIATFMSNPAAQVGVVMSALVREAPAEIAQEVANACLELLLCKEKGKLYWIDQAAQDILVGVRQMPESGSVVVGSTAHWPMEALLVGPPKSAIVRLPRGARRIWMACEELDGAVVRQSEAVALGNAMIESFGGRIIEDRRGPDVMRQSFIESNMTERAKRRAHALGQVDRMTVQERSRGVKEGHARVPMAEALPGACKVGMVFHPEERPQALYEVERRINEDWVLLVAQTHGREGNVPEAAAWVAPEAGDGPVGSDGPPHWGFTEAPAIAREDHATDEPSERPAEEAAEPGAAAEPSDG